MKKMSTLWQLAADATGNPELGLVAASLFQPAYIKGLGLAWMVSENLVEGLKLFIQNSQLVNTALQIELETRDDDIIIKYKRDEFSKDNLNVHPCAQQLGVGFFLRMFRLAAGKPIPATKAYFSLAIDQPSAYEDYFQCSIEDKSEFSGISFSSKLLTELLPTYDSDLLTLNTLAVENYLATLKQGQHSSRVTKILTKELPSGCPTEEEIAYRMNMSKRTLQRKLKDEGLSYFSLLNTLRSDLAKQYLSHTKHPITEVAYQLGYSSPSSFARAFKQQFGIPPLEYRASH
jgi:AraC-like DNA-binding protein